ncbi:MAG: hypothetical protein ACJAUH_000325 [Saprospiraceae bacterium]|jgi:hypothetical protein
MENWELEFYWNKAKHQVKSMMNLNALPDMNGVLFLIGVQELGRWDGEFTKEQKQDLMHIAICSLLESDGHYEFIGRDGDGWPHYELRKAVVNFGEESQEDLLKRKVIAYFEKLLIE